MHFLTTPLGRLRLLSLLDGIAYVVLLAIAMPLKYLANEPAPVALVGRVHGFLFVLLLIALARYAVGHWPAKRIGLVLLAAVVPLGAFALERVLAREQQAVV